MNFNNNTYKERMIAKEGLPNVTFIALDGTISDEVHYSLLQQESSYFTAHAIHSQANQIQTTYTIQTINACIFYLYTSFIFQPTEIHNMTEDHINIISELIDMSNYYLMDRCGLQAINLFTNISFQTLRTLPGTMITILNTAHKYHLTNVYNLFFLESLFYANQHLQPEYIHFLDIHILESLLKDNRINLAEHLIIKLIFRYYRKNLHPTSAKEIINPTCSSTEMDSSNNQYNDIPDYINTIVPFETDNEINEQIAITTVTRSFNNSWTISIVRDQIKINATKNSIIINQLLKHVKFATPNISALLSLPLEYISPYFQEVQQSIFEIMQRSVQLQPTALTTFIPTRFYTISASPLNPSTGYHFTPDACRYNAISLFAKSPYKIAFATTRSITILTAKVIVSSQKNPSIHGDTLDSQKNLTIEKDDFPPTVITSYQNNVDLVTRVGDEEICEEESHSHFIMSNLTLSQDSFYRFSVEAIDKVYPEMIYEIQFHCFNNNLPSTLTPFSDVPLKTVPL